MDGECANYSFILIDYSRPEFPSYFLGYFDADIFSLDFGSLEAFDGGLGFGFANEVDEGKVFNDVALGHFAVLLKQLAEAVVGVPIRKITDEDFCRRAIASPRHLTNGEGIQLLLRDTRILVSGFPREYGVIVSSQYVP